MTTVSNLPASHDRPPGLAESFWASLKRELIDWSHVTTHAEARAAVFEWINWYNHERLHTPRCRCSHHTSSSRTSRVNHSQHEAVSAPAGDVQTMLVR